MVCEDGCKVVYQGICALCLKEVKCVPGWSGVPCADPSHLTPAAQLQLPTVESVGEGVKDLLWL